MQLEMPHWLTVKSSMTSPRSAPGKRAVTRVVSRVSSSRTGEHESRHDALSPVCHVTSVHTRTDGRIFQKECVGLAASGYPTRLIVCDGRGHETIMGVRIVDAGFPGTSRWHRLFRSPILIRRVLANDPPRLAHIHDPELLVLVPWLRRKGIRVVYDSHENWPAQILRKHYLPLWSRRLIRRFSMWYESYFVRRVDLVIGVTEGNVLRLAKLNPRASLLRNYVLTERFAANRAVKRSPRACYVGGITVERGALEMARAARMIRSGLLLAGSVQDDDLARRIRLESAGRARLLGFLPSEGVAQLLTRSSIGLICLHPLKDYMDSSPNKLFEYMAAGLAVVASNFPAWRSIIEENRCGVCVDPLDHHSIAEAVNRLLRNPAEARRMGENGRRAVRKKYSWESEAATLRAAYASLLPQG
jgi:glycosyltransferase involved in cell wall biosynthesis